MTLANQKLAVLIDADNASYRKIPLILQEVAKYGIASVKKVYGDWSKENLGSWREVLLPHAITPVQQFAYTNGKDATDMVMIIDAMDLLYSKSLDGFCLVTSDSDFTPLASRIRESGLMVYGFGEQNKTPQAFISACDKFIYVENLEKIEKSDSSQQISTSSLVEIDAQIIQLIHKAIKDTADEGGWSNLADLGKHLVVLMPDFDTRTYGRSKLSGFLQKIPTLDIDERGTQKFVRKKPSFSPFLGVVQDTIEKYFEPNQWINCSKLVEKINQDYPSIDVQQYGCANLLLAIDKINSKYFEFDSLRSNIRLLK